MQRSSIRHHCRWICQIVQGDIPYHSVAAENEESQLPSECECLQGHPHVFPRWDLECETLQHVWRLTGSKHNSLGLIFGAFGPAAPPCRGHCPSLSRVFIIGGDWGVTGCRHKRLGPIFGALRPSAPPWPSLYRAFVIGREWAFTGCRINSGHHG